MVHDLPKVQIMRTSKLAKEDSKSSKIYFGGFQVKLFSTYLYILFINKQETKLAYYKPVTDDHKQQSVSQMIKEKKARLSIYLSAYLYINL